MHLITCVFIQIHLHSLKMAAQHDHQE